ncbi:MAG: site-2 protease family protein [Syntrophobacteraceae bacterium]
MGYLMVVVILGLLILVHELGHLAAAKYVRIPIERFSAGFGPKVWGFRMGGTEYWLSLVPLGGYVLPRVQSEEEFSRFPLRDRILFSLGGPFANILAAFACLSASHAAGAGISLESLLAAPCRELYGTFIQIVSAIPTFFNHPDKLSGIIGIVAFGGQHASVDVARLLGFSIMLSVNLAVFNLLPFPPLDGGRIVFSLLRSIYKPLDRLQLPMSITGWALMALLMLYTGVIDIGRIIAGIQI